MTVMKQDFCLICSRTAVISPPTQAIAKLEVLRPLDLPTPPSISSTSLTTPLVKVWPLEVLLPVVPPSISMKLMLGHHRLAHSSTTLVCATISPQTPQAIAKVGPMENLLPAAVNREGPLIPQHSLIIHKMYNTLLLLQKIILLQPRFPQASSFITDDQLILGISEHLHLMRLRRHPRLVIVSTFNFVTIIFVLNPDYPASVDMDKFISTLVCCLPLPLYLFFHYVF